MPPPETLSPGRLRIPVGDLVFDATVAGPAHGRTVLLLHGFPQSSWSWRRVMPRLAEAGLRAIALDQRGYSLDASPDPVQAYTGEHLVADVLGVLDSLGLDAVDLVGHDWGAAVAWQTAGLHPERVRTLSVLSVPHPGAFLETLAHDPDQRARSTYMLDFARPGYEEVLLADDAAALRTLLGPSGDVDVAHMLQRLGTPERLRRALNWYAAQTRERNASIPPVDVPTLHLWSDQDPFLGEAATRATARFVTGPYELHVLAGVGHWIPEDAPETVGELLLSHLRRFPTQAV
ncbi:alpha/beta fold hydrolase [Nocardioides ferulae]|uniref:alpha/beta fold hydrolase n=1 Tax=Nocardioides ferulae TaxID=2340821 RepID=UPI00198165C8|nr:alpha/beta hydrolase [Nocardioides ferulae]